MKQFVSLSFFFLVGLSLFSGVRAAEDLQLFLPKTIYSNNELIELMGSLVNNTATANATPINNTVVNLTIFNSTGHIFSVNLTTNANGLFYSNSTHSSTSPTIRAPNLSGTYNVSANFSANVSATVSFTVVANKTIDEIFVFLNKSSFYTGQSVLATIKAVQRSGGNDLPVVSVALNGTLRSSTDAVQQSFNCTTGSDGQCNSTLAVPASAGSYYIEVSSYVGYATFKVLPFDVAVYAKDGTGTTIKDIYSAGDSATVEVQVSYNGSYTTGTYKVTGNISSAAGTIIRNLTGFTLNSTNSFIDREAFTVNNNFSSGVYTIRVTVDKAGGGQVNATTLFQVREWNLNMEKTATDSGFDYRYTAFINATVRFQAYPTYRANGTIIENLTNNMSVWLASGNGINVTFPNITYNSTCSCYTFNLTTPTDTGNYKLFTSAVYSSETLTVERTLTITNLTASAIPTNNNNARKEIFTNNEFIYLRPTASNRTATVNVTQGEIVAITFQDGTIKNYTTAANASAMNVSDSRFEWVYNSTSGLFTVDPPAQGGQYIVDLYVNNHSAFTQVKFTVKPYTTCTSAKGSADTSTSSDYWWQFKTTDTIYLQLAVTQYQSGTSTSANTSSSTSSYGYYGMGYGSGSQCTIGTSAQAVSNATLTVEKVINIQSGSEEVLNTSASTCQSLSTAGTYLCTLQANASKWDGGSHSVIVKITGPDGTVDRGYGNFEARAFYLYGWISSWSNKPTSNLTVNLNMYSAGSNWWSSSQGMSGTVSLEKIEYYGTPGDWLFPPITYNYTTASINASNTTNGQGTMSLPASYAPGGQWKTGSYTAVLKGTNEGGDIDYGRVWFEVRRWEAYSTPIEFEGSSYRYKYLFNTAENISLHVKIGNAGDGWDSSSQTLGGNVTVGVKKIEYYTTWPPKELNTSLYTYNILNVSQSNTPYYNANPATSSHYVLNISRTTGTWDSAYYNVILDINGTETGYGWFTAQAFWVETRQVNANGTEIYYNRGTGPVYFNTTTTRNQKWYGYYRTADFVNATFVDATLHTWQSTTAGWVQTNLNYPEDINVTVVNSSTRHLNGTATINITYNNGTWPSGWYYGELLVRNDGGETVTGNMYFSVQPFRVTTSVPQYTIGTAQNMTATMTINEPDWSSNAVVAGNYTLTSLTEEVWSGMSRQIINYSNYTIVGTFNGSTINITVQPNSGSWTTGWRYLQLTVKNNNDNTTATGYASFRATPFTVTATATSTTLGLMDNLTVNVSLTAPGTNAATIGNLTQIYYWGWPTNTYYNFTVGTCRSTNGAGNCQITGSALVNVTPPAEGWEEGYHYMYFTLTENTSTTPINDYNSVYFNARPKISGYMYSYTGDVGATQNTTLYLYSLQNLQGNSVTVNVTNVQYALSSSTCYSDSCRSYTSAQWQVVNPTTGAIFTNNSIGGSGYIKLVAPSGGWTLGTYVVRVYVTSGSDTGIIKNGQFRIRDTTPPNVTIAGPALGQIITSFTPTFVATTNENARCNFIIQNYNSVCGSNGSNSSVAYCSNAYNGSTYYWYYASAWGTVTTGGTNHSYAHPFAGATNQHYVLTVGCYDSDWNYGTNATTFLLNATDSAPPTVSDVGKNSTVASSYTLFFAKWNDNNNVSRFIFSWNATGSWVNDSYQNINGTPGWSNTTKFINVSAGTTVAWQIWANDSGNNWNATDIQTFTVTSNQAPWWSLLTRNTSTAGRSILFSANWTDDSGLSHYLLSWNNSGSWANETPVWFGYLGYATWSNVSKTLNSTANLSVGWYLYANDSVGQWNVTSLQVFTTASSAPSPSNTSANSSVNLSHVRFLTTWSDTSLSGFVFSWNQSGSWVNDSWLPFNATPGTSNATKYLNASSSVSWLFYANNSNNQWNSTPTQTLTVTANTAPRSTLLSSNTTTAGAIVGMSANWTDDIGVSQYIFSWNNSGAWANDTPASFSSSWSNITKTLNSTFPLTVGWQIFANDSTNQWNATSLRVIQTS